MENASKALIIAGAILISILLISVGVIIMNSTGNTQKTVQDSAQSTEIKSFNAQFTPFEGGGQSASQVRSLISTVKASNGTQGTGGHQVKIYGKTGTTAFNATTLKENTKYTVTLDYADDGYVSIVRVY